VYTLTTAVSFFHTSRRTRGVVSWTPEFSNDCNKTQTSKSNYLFWSWHVLALKSVELQVRWRHSEKSCRKNMSIHKSTSLATCLYCLIAEDPSLACV